jgi:hypothetical protein
MLCCFDLKHCRHRTAKTQNTLTEVFVSPWRNTVDVTAEAAAQKLAKYMPSMIQVYNFLTKQLPQNLGIIIANFGQSLPRMA